MSGRYRLWKYAGKKADPFYATKPWRLIRVAVLQRDMYQCQICKKRWANTVHHVIPRSERPDLSLEMNNLQSVCGFCHNQEHPEKWGAKPGDSELPGDIRIIKV